MKKIIDLFSGVGGLSIGFRNAGYNVVLANEIDASIANSYQKNHPETKMINEDITKLDIADTFAEYRDVGMIIGGPPCQGFSQKGKRLSLRDPRNYLFRYFFDVVKFVKPENFVIENVPNLLTAANGYFKNEIYELFESLGYEVISDVLNAKDYGVPQARRRAIIIGSLRKNVLKFPKKQNEMTTVWDAISDLAFLESGEGEQVQEYKFIPQSKYQEMMRKHSTNLYNHVATKHSALAIERMMLVPENGGREDLPEEHLTKSIFSGTWGRMDKNSQSVTITTRFDTPSSGRFTHPYLNRAITVREAARIQSFPDNMIFYGTKTSQMKQVGNAVPPLMAEAIANSILQGDL
ncbi:DNA cytosine methyltransferase [Loigolactobacillus coryniformis]|jgi:DNA (cytosine-5)-methyltransferase 1|uniref:DNA (Cytosine-5-)-methyltransferase n=1 Tax=Loigolactobacillus coryniformis subsp. torquens DSM 20004 = KCTC 3535 TaxID=1423822 RepID=A0A2D1KP68_9LACO|nr:DNA cytosine methyltransferase [Loigolactobacillus coryniformis]ATO43928.1 DNA (cytosine-5-)-methyltransferase [Loigolactobacillus coryniformis subsp. torquens DSM 20004 = KCTC 3535]KRK74444.1 cytosine specific DNA methyltransferase [Loigolactobacillus coryniformis subsp. torquens DSM 20004 = KCTC 3535]